RGIGELLPLALCSTYCTSEWGEAVLVALARLGPGLEQDRNNVRTNRKTPPNKEQSRRPPNPKAPRLLRILEAAGPRPLGRTQRRHEADMYLLDPSRSASLLIA